jgi:FixJ family two-component response regulator
MKKTYTVFAVDDDAAILDSLHYLVKSLGYSYEAYTSTEAFWKAKDPSKSGCLILDMAMPDQTGEELFDQLNAAGIHWPTIAITGHGELALCVRMVKKGLFDFLEKPFSADKLRILIQQAIQKDTQDRESAHRSTELIEKLNAISDQHKSILRRMRTGASTKEIALSLDLSLRTVQIKRAQLARKFGIEGRSGWIKLIAELNRVEF